MVVVVKGVGTHLRVQWVGSSHAILPSPPPPLAAPLLVSGEVPHPQYKCAPLDAARPSHLHSFRCSEASGGGGGSCSWIPLRIYVRGATGWGDSSTAKTSSHVQESQTCKPWALSRKGSATHVRLRTYTHRERSVLIVTQFDGQTSRTVECAQSNTRNIMARLFSKSLPRCFGPDARDC